MNNEDTEFNPNHGYGRKIRITSLYSAIVPGTFIYDFIVKDARKILPPGTIFEIRGTIPRLLENNKVDRQVAWYYYPGINMTWDNTDGYIPIAKVIA